MTKKSRRACVAAAAAVATCAAAVPAFADGGSTGVPVSVTTSGGTRQFAVESVTGQTLSALDLGKAASSPFRVRVTDNAFDPGTTNPFSVSAVMNNLYQVNSSGTGYAYNVSIPSSAARITFPANPLAALGVSVPVDPTVLLSGTLPTCGQLNTLLSGGSVTGLGGLLNAVTGTALSLLDPLCAALDSLSASANKVLASVPLSQTLQKTLSDVLATLPLSDLPVNLSSVAGGSFSSPDYSSGIGAADTGKPAGAPAATAVNLLSGKENVTSALAAVVQGAFAGIPLVGTGATQGLAQVSDVLTALRNAVTGPLLAVVNQLVASTNTTAVADVLNTLTASLGSISVGNLLNLTGSYLSFPSISVTPPAGTPAGTYKGTMTVTYLQQ